MLFYIYTTHCLHIVHCPTDSKCLLFLQGDSEHLQGTVCMKAVVKECELDAPERITSTKLRKYMATVSQVCTAQQTEIFNTRITMGGVIYQ